MDNEQEEYYDENMFQNLSDTSMRYDNQQPINDLEFRWGMANPDAKDIFIDITRDMMLSNLDPEELKVVRIKSSVVKELQNIQDRCHLGHDKITNSFRHDREVILASSLSKEGYLRENLISNIKKFSLDRKNSQKPGLNKLKLRWGQDSDNQQ